jgi:DNA-binding NtrC family response regulator
LYYRLNVLRIHLPPLREREDDVLLLAAHFLAHERAQLKRTIVGFTPEAQRRLQLHSWPGNVRELQNAVAQACLRAKGDRIGAGDVSFGSVARRGASDPVSALEDALVAFLGAFAGEAHERVERMLFGAALGLARGNQVHAARLLGVTRNVVRNRMVKHTISGIEVRSRSGSAGNTCDEETTGA